MATQLKEPVSHVTYHKAMIQGSDEWHAARCGLLTASEIKLLMTPTLKKASNDRQRSHFYEILAQRISGYVEPHYIGDDMLRGWDDEMRARTLYSKRYAPVQDVGFVTNNRWGFTLGYSPDGLVGDDGLIECKSRRQKFQVQTIVENVATETVPDEFMFQVQCGLLVTERKWLDFISYSGGLPMAVVRAYPDPTIQGAIVETASDFEAQIAAKMPIYRKTIADLVPTERVIEQQMYV